MLSDQPSLSNLREQLGAQLQTLGYESIVGALAALKTQQEKYVRFQNKNTTPAKRSKKSIEKLEALAALIQQIEALEQQERMVAMGNNVDELKRQLASKLGEQGFTTINEVAGSLDEATKRLETMVNKDSEDAEELKDEIAEYEEILALHERITALEDAPAVAGPDTPSTTTTTTTATTTASSPAPPAVLKRSPSIQRADELQHEADILDNQVPECAEKTLAKLAIHFQMLSASENRRFIFETSGERDAFEQLKAQIREEGLEETAVTEKLAAIEAGLAAEAHDAGELASACQNLLSHLRPVNMELMIDLIEGNEASAEQIKDQDIVLLLGKTGSGKTTTIHILAGAEIQETFIAGQPHYVPANGLPELAEFVVSPHSRSETKTIRATSVALSDGETKVMVCDSPGLHDTDGCERDIANGMGIVNAVKGCRSVRPVVLMSYLSFGDRAEGFSELSTELVKLFGDIKAQLPSLTYVFTKVPTQGHERGLSEYIASKVSQLPAHERNNAAFVQLLTDMQQQTQEGAIVVHPLEAGERDHLLTQIMQKAAIENPAEVFQTFASEASLAKLKEQLHKIDASIENALQRRDMALVEYKLKQLMKLSQALDLADCREACGASVKRVNVAIDAFVQRFVVRFDQVTVDVDFDLEAEYQACEDDLDTLLKLNKLHQAFPEYFDTDVVSDCSTRLYEKTLQRIDALNVEEVTTDQLLRFIRDIKVLHVANHRVSTLPEAVQQGIASFALGLRLHEKISAYLTQVDAALTEQKFSIVNRVLQQVKALSSCIVKKVEDDDLVLSNAGDTDEHDAFDLEDTFMTDLGADEKLGLEAPIGDDIDENIKAFQADLQEKVSKKEALLQERLIGLVNQYRATSIIGAKKTTDGSALTMSQKVLLYLEFLKEHSPVDVLAELGRAADGEKNNVFAQASQQVYRCLEIDLKMLLGVVKIDEDFEQCLALIEAFEQASHFIPVEIYQAAIDDLVLLKEAVATKKERFEGVVSAAAQARDLFKLVDDFIHFAERKQYSRARKVREAARGLIFEGMGQFDELLNRGDLESVFATLPKQWTHWRYYLTQLTEMPASLVESIPPRHAPLYQDTELEMYCNEFFEKLEHAIDTLLAGFESKQGEAERFDFVAYVEANFRVLDRFFALSDEKDAAEFFVVIALLGSDIALRAENVVKAAQALLVTLNEELADKLEKGEDLTSIAADLDLYERSESMREKLTIYAASSYGEKVHPDLKEALAKCRSYTQMRELLTQSVLAWQTSLDVKFFKNPALETADADAQMEFYKKLNGDFERIKQVHGFARHLMPGSMSVDHLVEDAVAKMEANLGELKAELSSMMALFFQSDDKEIYEQFNLWLVNLALFQAHFEDARLQQVAEAFVSTLSMEFGVKVSSLCKTAWASRVNLDELVDALINLKLLANNVATHREFVNGEIDHLLNEIKAEPGGAQKIAQLALRLNECKQASRQAVAQMLITDHDAFTGYALSLRNEKTLRFTIDDVLGGLEGDDLDKESLKRHYDDFIKKYWDNVQKGLGANLAEQKIALIDAAHNLVDRQPHQQPTQAMVSELMACVFAYWTLDHSQHYMEAQASRTAGNAKNYLMQPHPAQVIAILRLLGFGQAALKGDDRLTLSNHLVEMLTGEGKSVTLAAPTIIFALLGFDVHDACYSPHLSERDFNDFYGLFNAFVPENMPQYGTFDVLCEKLINEEGDIRERVVRRMMQAEDHEEGEPSVPRRKILFADEADVFFRRDFYGSAYKPLASVKDATVSDLVNDLWKNRHNPDALKLANVQVSAAYQTCMARFPDYAELLEECVKSMLYDLNTFESHDYIVHDRRIAYKEQDGLSFTAAYGYKTMFAWFKEAEAHRVDVSARDEQVALLIDCGDFSYAEVPKLYEYIMGATGTLRTLNAPQKDILTDEYNIRQCTYIPSVYGKRKLAFAGDSERDVHIVPDSDHFRAIRNEMNKRLVGSDEVDRAVLVFFESKAELIEFYNSPAMVDLKTQARIMTEETSSTDKETLVRQAVTSGAITLLTREFGRGTDFKCHDDQLNSVGGVHVLQTFVSDDVSEETQIKGRTARQGDDGSYSMVIKESALERYGIGKEKIEEMREQGQFYSVIDPARRDFYDRQYAEEIRHVGEVREEHVKACKFLDYLAEGDDEAIKAFLLERNKTTTVSSGAKSSRTIVLMDATGSMSGLLQKAKNTVQKMFDRAHAVLQEEGLGETAFELQFAVYRNYNANKPLEYSPWTTNPGELRQFMETIDVDGGMGNEAMELGFWHANQEAANENGGVDQVILIGDMPANTRSEVDSRRGQMRDEAATQFPAPVYWDTELDQLKEKGIPVQACYIPSYWINVESTQKAFASYAEQTGGQPNKLDIDSPEGAEMLTNLVTERILHGVGGEARGAQLVEAYRAKFTRGHVAGASTANTATAASRSKSARSVAPANIPSPATFFAPKAPPAGAAKGKKKDAAAASASKATVFGGDAGANGASSANPYGAAPGKLANDDGCRIM